MSDSINSHVIVDDSEAKAAPRLPKFMSIWRPADLRALKIETVTPIQPAQDGDRIQRVTLTFERDGAINEPFDLDLADVGYQHVEAGRYLGVDASGKLCVLDGEHLEMLYRKA